MRDIAITYDASFTGCVYTLPPSAITQGRDANGNVSTSLETTLTVDLSASGLPAICRPLTTGFATVTATAHDWAGDTSSVEIHLCLDAICKG